MVSLISKDPGEEKVDCDLSQTGRDSLRLKKSQTRRSAHPDLRVQYGGSSGYYENARLVIKHPTISHREDLGDAVGVKRSPVGDLHVVGGLYYRGCNTKLHFLSKIADKHRQKWRKSTTI